MVEVVTEFLFLDSKITADGECSHEIKRYMLLSRKAMINLDSVLKSRHHSVNKGPYSQGYGLPVVRHSYESCTVKKAEHRGIDDVFELRCWRRFLRAPWTAKKSK